MKVILKVIILYLLIPCTTKASGSSNPVDSILKQIEKYNDKNKVKTLNDQCWKLKVHYPKDALTLCEKALVISERRNFLKQQATTLNYLGVLYQNTGKLDSALIYYEKALVTAKRSKNIEELAYAYNNFGDYYFDLALYTRALENVLESHRIFSRLNNKRGLAYSLSNLSDIYIQQQLYDRALDTLKSALKIRQTLQDDIRLSITRQKIASIYVIKSEYNKALELYDQLEKDNQKKDYPLRQAVISEGISDVYYAQKKYADALLHLQYAHSIYRKIKNQQGETKTLNKLGSVYTALQQYADAKKSLTDAESLATSSNNKTEKVINYKLQATLAEVTEDYKTAILYNHLYSSLRDNIFSFDKQKNIMEMFTIYETTKIQKEILKKNLTRKNLLAWLTAGFIFLICITIYLLYQRQKNKRVNKELIELNRSKDKFFSILSHDLKGPIGDLMGLSNILDDNYEVFNDQRIKEMIKVMRVSTYNVYGLLNRLLEWSRAATGRIEYSPVSFPVYKEVDSVLQLMANMAKNKSIHLVSEIDTSHKVKADPNMVNTIIRNLVSNAIKFTPVKGNIALFSIKKDNKINITVADSGVGISKTEIDDVLRIDVRHTKTGTNNEKGTGVGLALCAELIKTNKGKIWIESIPGKGSKFYFSLPASD